MLFLFKIFSIILLIVALLPFQMLFVLIKSDLRFSLPKVFHKKLLSILGVGVNVYGNPANAKPLFLVGNHTSYLDIVILGSLFPICFIAKEEIRKWFLFGLLAKLQNSIFINRRNTKILEAIKKINKNIGKSFAIVLFPEGTTSNGKKILNFKSSLFSIFEQDALLALQNFSLCYTHINGLPIDNRLRPIISWYGDMSMLNHLKALINQKSINASIVFHPLMKTTGLNRKEISLLSREQVKKGFYSVN